MHLFLIKSVQADNGVNIGEYFTPALKGFTTVSALINVLLPNIFTIAGVIALAGVVIAGFNVISHGVSGKSEGLQKSKQSLTYSIMGLVLIFAAYFIMEIIQTILGYNLLNPAIGNP